MTRRLHLARLRKFFNERVPFHRFLGLELSSLRPGRAVLRLPYRRAFVGDITRPALHGGVLSAMLDTACGAAVFSLVGPHDRISTLDLRVDYLLPAPRKTLVAEAEVIRIGNRVGVARGRLRAAGSRKLLAESTALFSIRRKRQTD